MHGSSAPARNGLTTTEYEHQLTGMLKLIRSIDEANES